MIRHAFTVKFSVMRRRLYIMRKAIAVDLTHNVRGLQIHTYTV